MTTTAAPAPSTYRDYSAPLWRRLLFNREGAIVAILVAVWLYSYFFVAHFSGPLTTYYLFLDIAPTMLMALPLTLVIVTGEIDLSIASVLGLSSVLIGLLYQAGVPVPVAILIALAAGVLCGLFNGFLVAYVGLPSLAVTIGTLALFRGIAVGLSGTRAVTNFPESWLNLAQQKIPGTPVPTIVIPIIVLAIVFALILHFSSFGRGIFDIGLNKEAAHFTGVNVARTKLTLFAFSGLVSAFAGVFYTMYFGTSRGNNGLGLELQVVAAVLLGGISIFGGRGRLHGVIAGVLLIGVMSSALRLEGHPATVINIVIGLLLVLSVMSTSLWAGSRWLWARIRGRGLLPASTPAGGVGTEGR